MHRPSRTPLLAACLAAGAWSLQAASLHAAVVVTRPVHVQAVTPDSVTIVWHTQEPAFAAVDYGPTPEYGRSAQSKIAAREHAVTLHRLSPDQTYYYRVRCDAETLYSGPEYRFRALPDKRTTRARILVWGDSGRGNAAQYSLVPTMEAADPDLMIHVGDLIQTDGAASRFDPFYFVPYRNLLRHTPVWPVLGNHDVLTADGQPFLDAFLLPRNSPAGDERSYSFNWGQVHLLAIDTNRPFDPAFLAWVADDLASTTTTWKLAYMHHPMYSCGLHGSSRSVRDLLAPIFEAHGVDLVFSGHDHDFQRSHPMRAGVPVDTAQAPHFTAPGGIIYIGTGGGSTVRSTSSVCEFTAFAVSRTHCTVLDIDGAFLRLRALGTDGSAIHEISIDKSAGGEAAGVPNPPLRALLLPNTPNPFNPSTTLRYELLDALPVRLTIHDLRGRRIAAFSVGPQPTGRHSLLWDGRDLAGRPVATGIYMVRLRAGAAETARKIVLAE
jgi:predicted phosphodiesterase